MSYVRGIAANGGRRLTLFTSENERPISSSGSYLRLDADTTDPIESLTRSVSEAGGRAFCVVAFEVKLAETVSRSDIRQMRVLRDKLGDAFRAGVVVHPGVTAPRIEDRIVAVPLGTLV